MFKSEDLEIFRKELGGKKKPFYFPITTIQKVYLIGQEYEENTPRFLFYWLYLTGQRITEALRTKKSDLEFVNENGKKTIVVNSITLKNRVKPFRIIPIPVYGEEEKMAKYVLKNIYHLKPKEKLFNFTRMTAWNYLSQVTINIPAILPNNREIINLDLRIYPHYLRHCRATHIAKKPNCTVSHLMQFFGWSRSNVANTYISFNWRDLSKLFEK